MKYNVSVIVDATVNVEVEANSPEEAKEKALFLAEVPSLCHQCARELELGDAVSACEPDPA